MSDIAIRVDSLGKRYRIGGKRERYKTLRDTVTDAMVSPFRRAGKLLRGEASGAAELNETIWALKDVTFEIKHGEVVGIIGRNGAGKTTLLKILSRITEPSDGHVDIYGRVGSLLEVGTGFHPELTGRDNIYLNGAILGMRKADIARKFDEIVDFAEIEKFIDTPVKHYSSGMYMRLAFAVAAYLEPEILLVDEVLAVGDAAFQKKCLGKMGDVAKEGRTVLFVSHQLAMINTLCEIAVLLSDGQLIDRGAASRVVDRYLCTFVNNGSASAIVDYPENLIAKAQILKASISGSDGQPSVRYDVFERIELKVTYIFREPMDGVAVNLVVKRNGEILFVSFDTDDQPQLLGFRSPGVYTTTVQLPSPLKSGKYTIDLSLGRPNVGGVDLRREALAFEVEELSFDTSMRSYSSKRPGMMAAHLHWNTYQEQAIPEPALQM